MIATNDLQYNSDDNKFLLFFVRIIFLSTFFIVINKFDRYSDIFPNLTIQRILAMQGKMPIKFGFFLTYCEDAFLLQHTGSRYAFVHILLRDHFALRELTPRLQDPDPGKRLLTVQRLACLGDTAHDALEMATHDEDDRVRQAALTALNNKEIR
jgi:hypothetical protein